MRTGTRLAVLAAVLAALPSAPAGAVVPPDELDVFRINNPDPTALPHVLLLIDTSGALNGSTSSPSCPWFNSTYYGGTAPSTTYGVLLQEVLLGCTSATDGLFSQFAGQVSIAAIDEHNNTIFDYTDVASVQKTAFWNWAQGHTTGNTDLNAAQGTAAQYDQNHLTSSALAPCAHVSTVVISRGHSNGSAVSYSFACNGASVSANSSSPGAVAQYLYQNPIVCGSGNQSITTYAVGINPSSHDLTNLQSVASMGGGAYADGSNYTALKNALSNFLQLVSTQTSFTFSNIAIQRNSSFFAGSAAYVSSYELQQPGEFWGNMKKSCILPRLLANGTYTTTVTNCLFKSTTGTNLLTNPAAGDMWTGTATTQVNTGGSGAKIMTAIGSTTDWGSAPPRNLLSWSPGGTAYKAFTLGNFADSDLWTTAGDRYNLVNRVYGYTWADNPLSLPTTGDPVTHWSWAQADTVHPETALIQYNSDCTTAGHCYAVQASNDGMIRFIDAATGSEFVSIIPAEILKPTYLANKNLIRDLRSQPSNDGIHRYYVDGGLKIFHNDTNGNGIVDGGEKAYLIVGLGRGGRAYYKIDLSTQPAANMASNPVYPLTQAAAPSAFSELRETWATPWTGRVQVNGGFHNVAVFPTGHIPDFDFPTNPMPAKISGPPTIQTTSHACATLVTTATACTQLYPLGYVDPGVPMVYGPFSAPNAIAYSFHFSHFDVDSGDPVAPQDSQGVSAASLTGAGVHNQFWSADLSSGSTPYVYDTSAQITWTFDGSQSVLHTGWAIDTVTTIDKVPGASVQHYPSIFVTDLDNWNGNTAFASSPGVGGLLVQITRTCPSGGGAGACIDQNTAGAGDLKFMTCPISAPPAVYTQGSSIRGVYVGDECGQIWKAYPTALDGTGWKAVRLLNLNDQDPTDQNTSLGNSKDFRKIFRQLELVLSSCAGPQLLAVYFGTGNVQRPSATDELANSTLNGGRDVVGVFWDDGSTTNKYTADLYNATTVTSVDSLSAHAHGYAGWYWNLNANERMLRDPLVFLGVAYYKTHTPQSAAMCGDRSGYDTVYAVNNCSAAAVGTQQAGAITSRSGAAVWQGQQDIGGNLLLITPQTGQSFVSAANLNTQQNAAVYTNPVRKNLRMLLWRKPRGYER